MTFEEWANGKATWEMSAKDIWDAAYQAGREAMRQECLKECNDLHHQWRFGEDSTSGPLDCADAIKGIK